MEGSGAGRPAGGGSLAEGSRRRRRRPPEPLPALTAGQWQEVERQRRGLQAGSRWHGGLPVLLLERCWLRLTAVAVEDLALRLPPDATREAPELERFRELVARGRSAAEAELLCWEEFGAQACREALRRYWAAQEQGNHGWTLERYLAFLREYRLVFEAERPRPLPLLVLARPGEGPRVEPHGLFWLRTERGGSPRAIGHTCA